MTPGTPSGVSLGGHMITMPVQFSSIPVSPLPANRVTVSWWRCCLGHFKNTRDDDDDDDDDPRSQLLRQVVGGMKDGYCFSLTGVASMRFVALI